MSSAPKIAIIGGGPAGLLLGSLLSIASIPCTIYERDTSSASRTQGGTLDIHDDTGIIALKEAGLYDQFLEYARPEGEDFVIADKTGERYLDLQGTDDQPVGSGRPEIDREKLREILLASVPEHVIKWGSNIRQVREDKTIVLDSGTEGPFDLIIGADGGFSRVRALLSDTKAFYSSISGVELQISNADEREPEVFKHVGRGSFFVFSDGKGLQAQRLGDKSLRISCYQKTSEDFTKNFNARCPNGGPEGRREVLSYYHDWAPELQKWVTHADDDMAVRALFMLPVGFTWEHKEGFTLVGDAAHLWTPFAGEGVNAALMDSLSLSRAIVKFVKEGKELDAEVQDYETEMFGRTKPVAEETKRNLDIFFAPKFPPPNWAEMVAAMGPPPEEE